MDISAMSRQCYIYAIVNITSGRRYVGSSVTAKIRWFHHRMMLRGNRHHCRYLQNSWNKNGENNFKFVILETLESNERAVRTFAELKAIAAAPCYNSRISSLGLTNFENSPEVRKAISVTLNAKLKTDEEYRQILSAIGAALAAKARTPEARAKMSVHAKKLWTDPTHRKRISAKLAKHWAIPGMREEHSNRVKTIKGTPLEGSKALVFRIDPNA